MSYFDKCKDITIEETEGKKQITLIYTSNIVLQKQQVTMFEQYPNENIVKIRTLIKNEDLFLYYDISGMINLKSFILKGISYEVAKKITIEIIDLFTNASNLYAFEKNFVLDDNYIFINEYTLKPCLIYIPTDIQIDFTAKFKSFVSNLLVQGSKFSNLEISNNLDNLLKADKLDIKKLKDLLENNIEQIKVSIPDKERISELSMNDNLRNIVTPILNKINSKAISKPKVNDDKITHHKLILGISQVMIVIITYIIYYKFLRELNDAGQLMGLLILAGVIDYYIIKFFLNKMDNTINPKNENLQKSNIQRNIEINLNIPLEETGTIFLNKKEKKIEIDESDLTVKLNEKNFFLEDKLNNKLHQIIFNNSTFIIGRDKDVDLSIDDKNISRKHIEITMKNDKLYLKDLESTNGTFINENKIGSNVEIEIYHDDIINLAKKVTLKLFSK